MALSGCSGSVIAQYDVLKPQDQFQVYPAAKDSRGICICQDRDYRDVYQEKYGQMALTCPQKRYHLEC